MFSHLSLNKIITRVKELKSEKETKKQQLMAQNIYFAFFYNLKLILQRMPSYKQSSIYSMQDYNFEA